MSHDPTEDCLPTAPGLPPCRVVRSARKTVSLEITAAGKILLRAPLRQSRASLLSFLSDKRDWLVRRYASRAGNASLPPFSAQELDTMVRLAKEVIPARVAKYAPLVGVTWGRVTIRAQHSRWGSCTAEGNLNFNCLLTQVPLEVLDSVVLHELCHRRVMGHGKDFYALLYRVCPTYDACHAWLREHGGALLARLPQ